MTKKIICVWIGAFDSETDFYSDYLAHNYDNIDHPESKFGKDAELEYFDEDFIESWWFEKLTIENLVEYKTGLLEYSYFFEELLTVLKQKDLAQKNTITFLYGEKSSNSTNEMLFKYQGMKNTNKPIEFVFRKEYIIN